MISPTKTSAPLTILLVEDDDVDAMAVQRMFRRLVRPGDINIHRASDGEMGLAELELLVRAKTQKLIVLLDINMPMMNGHEFLDRLRDNPKLRSTPVFILSTSVDPSDVKLAYDRHVAGYFEKATNSPGDESIGRFLQTYSETVVLPG